MIRATVGILSSSAGGFDADYQAVLDYATTQTYTLPSESQKTLQNQLVVDLKDAGVWSKLDIFYVLATDGDSDFASINWKDPNNFEITEVNSPNFTTNEGFQSNGTSSYLNTNYSPTTSSIVSNTNASMGTWYYTGPNIQDNHGLRVGFNNSMFMINGLSSLRIFSDSIVGDTVQLTSGYTHHDKTSSGTGYIRYNSQTKNYTGLTDETVPNLDAFICAVNNNGTPAFFSPSNYPNMSLYYIGESFDISETIDVESAVNSYMTSI